MKKFVLAGKVLIGLSDKRDGDMKTDNYRDDADKQKVKENRAKFFCELNLGTDDTTLVWVDYKRESFIEFRVADDSWRGAGMWPDEPKIAADALITREKNLGLFLPLADCLGAVIFDPAREVLCVAHLGRHATEQFGALGVVKFLREKFDSDPRDLRIWLSPAASAQNYPLNKFSDKGLREVNVAQFVEAGVLGQNIFGAEIDTTTDPNYFSHSEALKTGENLGKRFAIVAKTI